MMPADATLCSFGRPGPISLTQLPKSKKRYSDRKSPDFPMASVCRVEGCCNSTAKGGQGLCGKHRQRLRRYGDVNYVTPREEWLRKCREGQLAVSPHAKPSTYKKLHHRHEHRVVAEKMLGRSLRRGEIVHHIDGNKHNNNPANLRVMTQSEHIRKHFFPDAEPLCWRGRQLWPNEFAQELNLSLHIVRNRIRAGWDLERIASTPVRKWTRDNA
jgi:hypothetical protein